MPVQQGNPYFIARYDQGIYHFILSGNIESGYVFLRFVCH
jgi:hypothetical protein